MKAVIYARYSSDNQREESIEGQLRECREYAKRNNIVILGEYIDRAMTGRSDDRPDFQRMIKDSYRHLFDVVLVWKLDRFARDRYASAHYKQILKKNGARLMSATENIGAGAEGIILESVLEGYAEYYSIELAEKTTRGMKENALNGKSNGGNITFGYRLTSESRYELDPELAPIVKEIFERYVAGEKMTDIVRDLNLRGIRNAKGKAITNNVVHRMLKNRRYLGEYTFRDVMNRDAIPAIIPQALFDCAQTLMQKNKKASARGKAEIEYILTTKLKCGRCGNLMVGESGTSATGTTYHYYKCSHAKRKMGCQKKAVRKDWIEDLAVRYAMQIVMDDSLIHTIAERVMGLWNQENTRLPQLQARLKETERHIQNMLNAIQQGILTPSTKQRLDELEQTKQEIEVAICQEQIKNPSITKEEIICYIKKFRDLNLDDINARKALIDNFINCIYLYDNKLLFTFNFKEGTKELSLNDLESDYLERSSDMRVEGSPVNKRGVAQVQHLFCLPVICTELNSANFRLRKFVKTCATVSTLPTA